MNRYHEKPFTIPGLKPGSFEWAAAVVSRALELDAVLVGAPAEQWRVAMAILGL